MSMHKIKSNIASFQINVLETAHLKSRRGYICLVSQYKMPLRLSRFALFKPQHTRMFIVSVSYGGVLILSTMTECEKRE